MLALDTLDRTTRPASSRSTDRPRFNATGGIGTAKGDPKIESGSSNDVAREGAAADRVFKDEMIALMPSLRSFARSLCGSRDMAEDLAQDAMLRGWAARASYVPGTNFKAWMFRIMRNRFYTILRHDRTISRWDPETSERILAAAPAQQDAIHVSDVAIALEKLNAGQQEVLMLVGANGVHYNEAARIIGCSIGTVKSRLARGRKALASLIDGPAGEALFDRHAVDQAI